LHCVKAYGRVVDTSTHSEPRKLVQQSVRVANLKRPTTIPPGKNRPVPPGWGGGGEVVLGGFEKIKNFLRLPGIELRFFGCHARDLFTTMTKGKVHSRTGHEGSKKEKYSSTLPLTSLLDEGGRWSTPRPGRFTPWNGPVIE
jgi:hypothetical protein